MRLAIVGVVIFTACAVGAIRAGDDKGGELTVLKRADLEKLEGVWQLKADPKEGWKGAVRATIKLYEVDDKVVADFGYIQYDADLTKGTHNLKITGTDPISFAGIKRGKSLALVTSKKFARPAPFKVDAKDDLSAAFEVKNDILTLDLSKSLKAFVPDTINELKIDWSKATWERVKK